MAYKLLAVDIDGTLVNSRSKLTPETKKAIKLAVNEGIIFTISTGRPLQGVRPLAEELGLEKDLPFITYNGAMVVLSKSSEIIYQQALLPKDALNIVQLGEQFGTSVMVWKNNNLYTTRLDDRAYNYSQISKVTPLLIDDISSLLKDGATKILWYDEINRINEFEQAVGEFLGGNVNYHTSKPFFLEFVDKRASKAIAMEKIGLRFGIGQSEMIAVGDGFNDLSMIEYAGLGVAMGNAAAAIKDKADYVTASNDEDGVAEVIYKFMVK